MPFHHGQMHGITCGQALVTEDDLFRALGNGPVHREHFIHHV